MLKNVSHHDEEVSSHDSLSDDELQEVKMAMRRTLMAFPVTAIYNLIIIINSMISLATITSYITVE